MKITKFADLNGNGKRDGSSEYGVEGWAFQVTGEGFSKSVTTGADGNASLSLSPGEYKVQENTQDGWVATTDKSRSVIIESGKTTPVEFGNKPGVDLTIKGLDNSSKNGIPGWTFNVQGPQGPSTLSSNPDGSATVGGIPGKYTVTANPPTGYELTTENPLEKNLPNPGDKGQVEFGAKLIGSWIVITKFEDLDRNGVREQNEPALSGWNFSIDGTDTVTTGNDGTVIRSVSTGPHTVKEIPISGWISTINTPDTKTLSSNERWNLSFGNYPKQSLTIFNYNDQDNNSIYDNNERGLAGWDFTITDQNGNKRIATTNSSGIATADLMPSMNYTITSPAVGKWVTTTAKQVSLRTDLNPGNYKEDFGQYLAPPTDIKIFSFNDTADKNGKWENRESGLPGWEFSISGPDINKTVITGSNGWYNFSTEVPGKYTVKESTKSDWTNTNETEKEVSVVSGGIDQPLYFGNALIPLPLPGTTPTCVGCGEKPKPMEASNSDLRVIKSVDPKVLDVNAINTGCGNEIEYNLTLIPEMKQLPTDAIILVDTSGSLWEFPDKVRHDIINGLIRFADSEKTSGNTNLRIGLITYDEVGKTLVPITDNFDALVAAANNISFNSENKTFTNVGIGAAVKALNEAPSKAEKVIVLVTDAKGEGSQTEPGNLTGYKVQALVVVGHEEKPLKDMLRNLTAAHGGIVTDVNDSSTISKALSAGVQITEKGSLKGVRLVDTLPNFLALNHSSLSKKANVTINHDGRDWSTTTLTWDIPNLNTPWNVTFRAAFCWNLPADASFVAGASLPMSDVVYTNSTGGVGRLGIPEGEIKLGQVAGSAPLLPERKPSNLSIPGITPGFDAWIAIGGLTVMVYLLRGKNGKA